MMLRCIACLLLLLTAAPAFAGYTLFVRDQVTPATITVNGVNGPEVRPNRGPIPAYPVTFSGQVCTAADIYSPDAASRTEVWLDAAGTATAAEVLTACPGLKAQVAEQLKTIRQLALDKVARSPGVLAVYDENYRAAQAYQAGAGDTTIMKDGRTATAYLAGFGARLGMTAGQFAAYIVSENQRVAPTAIEDEYLRLVYGLIPTLQDVDILLGLPDSFRRFCGL